MRKPTTFSRSLLEASLAVFNDKSHDGLLSCPHMTLSADVLCVGLEEGTNAVVLHLLPSGEQDVLVVGEPHADTLRRLKQLCLRLDKAWEGAGITNARGAYKAALTLHAHEQEALDRQCASV